MPDDGQRTVLQVGAVTCRYCRNVQSTGSLCERCGMKLPQIVAITDLPHVMSQKVLLKSGLHRKGERNLPHPAYAAANPLTWFERDAADWLKDDAARRAT